MIPVINDRTRGDFQFESGKIHAFLNPYTYLLLRENPDILRRFDIIHFDGIALCRVFEWFRVKKVNRRSFDMTSIARDVFEEAAKSGKRIAFVGTEEGVVDEAVKTLQEAFSFEVALTRHGYFSSDEEIEQFQRKLAEVNPDIVVVGMGAIRQETFLIQLKELGWKGTGFTCGGFLHQTACRLDFYPAMFDRLNLRWVWRVWKDPYVIRRYLFDYPKFLVVFVKDYFAWRRLKASEQG